MERVLSFLYLREYYEDGHIIQYQQPMSALAICDHESDSSLPENKREFPEAASQAAFNNIEVFIAADKYALATLKFSRWANTNYSSPMFHEVVQKVMTSVPPHESALLEVIADIITSHIFDLIKIPEIVHNFGCLGSLVITRLVSKEMAKRPNEYDVLRALVQKINSSRRCRHCAKDFNVRLISGEYLDENFRCASCNTRNWSVLFYFLRFHHKGLPHYSKVEKGETENQSYVAFSIALKPYSIP